MTHKMKMQEQLEEVLLIMAEKGLIPYKDGNQWCILLGPNLQEGICGFGYTIIDAMMDFYQEAKAEGIIRNEEQKSAEDKTIEDVISYLNDGMCFNSQIEELKYRNNLTNRLKSLRPQWKPTDVCYGIKGDPDPAGVWKPSEEQINALNFAITYFMHETNYKNPTELRDLYDDLLKLKQL